MKLQNIILIVKSKSTGESVGLPGIRANRSHVATSVKRPSPVVPTGARRRYCDRGLPNLATLLWNRMKDSDGSSEFRIFALELNRISNQWLEDQRYRRLRM